MDEMGIKLSDSSLEAATNIVVSALIESVDAGFNMTKEIDIPYIGIQFISGIAI